MEVVSGDNWSYKSHKAPVKSSPPGVWGRSQWGEVRQVVSPTLPFPVSLPPPFHSPYILSLTSGREGQIQCGGSSPAPPPYKYHPDHHQQTNTQYFLQSVNESHLLLQLVASVESRLQLGHGWVKLCTKFSHLQPNTVHGVNKMLSWCPQTRATRSGVNRAEMEQGQWHWPIDMNYN